MGKLLLLIFTMVAFCSCSEKENWTNLLDKELSQWDNYLSFRYEIGEDGEAQIPQGADGNLVLPVGLNNDNSKVFTVVEEGNENILKISGEIYGCVFTKEEYENYHFRLKVKWGDKKWEPRKKLLKDSGIMYHSIGPPGAEGWQSWMLSQEFQIMEGHMGDYWTQATSAIDVRAFIPEYIMNPLADPSQPFLSIGGDDQVSGYCLRSANYESENGEWTSLELICFENKVLHIVNGNVVMILKNSRYVDGGTNVPMNRGKIQLQSEAAEVFFKGIEVRNIESLPDRYAQYFD